MERGAAEKDEAQLPEVFTEAQERRILELIQQELLKENQKGWAGWPATEPA